MEGAVTRQTGQRLSGGSARGVGVLRGGGERLWDLLRRRVHPHDLSAVAVEVDRRRLQRGSTGWPLLHLLWETHGRDTTKPV
jgi:hypothetical protein